MKNAVLCINRLNLAEKHLEINSRKQTGDKNSVPGIQFKLQYTCEHIIGPNHTI